MDKMTVSEAIGRLCAYEATMRGRKQEREEEQQLLLTREQWENLYANENRLGGFRDRGRAHPGCGTDNRSPPKFDKTKVRCIIVQACVTMLISAGKKPRMRHTIIFTLSREASGEQPLSFLFHSYPTYLRNQRMKRLASSSRL